MTIETNLTGYSLKGGRIAGRSGIEILMDDLGHALARGGGRVRMLGGGNPAHIPAVEAVWRRRMEEILGEGDRFERMLGNYDPPRGNPDFLRHLAALLRAEFGWDIGVEHLAVTSGGQTAFFQLFNLLAGDMGGGVRRSVVLPLAPEYIGYANQGLDPGMFSARRPLVSHPGPHRFKYGVDFDTLHLDESAGLVCVSRPTNPSGNVLTDDEIRRLAGLCRERGVPLVIDNAYGMPFPDILFAEATPYWDENTILTISLSKLGLPGTRTAVVVARPEIARAIQSMVAVTGLANGNIGQAITEPMLANGELLALARDVIKPYYREKAALARAAVEEFFPDSMDYLLHETEGAMFLWFWFRGLPISSSELYQRLKQRGVLVVPGEPFFFGLPVGDWPHSRECLRVSFAMDEGVVREGLRVISEEACRAYRGG